jgi:hypothetical protein
MEYWSENPPLNILVKGFVFGVSGREKNGKFTPPTMPLPSSSEGGVPEFTDAQFNQLSQLMGGAEIIGKPKAI